jgi:beta-lactam-binding protein with PASTA domain
VVGKSETSAIRKLKNAGFKVKKATQTRTSGKDGVVLSQSRPGGTRAKPKSVVRIVISNVGKIIGPGRPQAVGGRRNGIERHKAQQVSVKSYPPLSTSRVGVFALVIPIMRPGL